MTLQKQLDAIAEQLGLPGKYQIHLVIPPPPPHGAILQGDLKEAFVQACTELHKLGAIMGKYADLIVKNAPDKANVQNVKPCLPPLMEHTGEALESLRRHQREAHKSERRFYDSAIRAVERLTALLKAVENGELELEFVTEQVVELFHGFGGDAQALRDAFLRGGVPEAFEKILELGLSRDYKLVVQNNELYFSGGDDGGLIPIQFGDHDLVRERVEALKAEISSPEPSAV